MTAPAKPLVSVLMPAFNAEATLVEALESALASTYPNLEIVLVDDGSTDLTWGIAEQFADRDARVRPFRQVHGGVSAALNRGLAEVRGHYVARLDADDLWHPAKLDKQVECIVADRAIALVYTFVRFVDADGRVLRDGSPQHFARHALCQCLYEGIIGGGSSVLVRRSVLERMGAYDEGLTVWEDLLMHLHVAAAGGTAFVPEYLVGYRVRPSSSSSDRQVSLDSWRRARRRIRSDFPQIPAFVHRWSDARRLLELAQSLALDGQYRTAAALLGQSFALDFTRASRVLVYHLRRRLAGNAKFAEAAGPPFDACDPAQTYRVTRFDAGPEAKAVRALDARRQRLLESIGEEIASADASA